MSEAKDTQRKAEQKRTTGETDITCILLLDGTGQADIQTGIGFLDHMLHALTKHARFDLSLHCKGDLHVDDHHTSEDCALLLGSTFDECLGERRGIKRFGSAYAPLDEALARVVIDLSGRPFAHCDLQLRRERIGDWACENMGHFFESFAMQARMSLHVDILRGQNAHHQVEAAFKAFALALRDAIAHQEFSDIPSTKGLL